MVKVAITGIGLVTPLGSGADAVLDRILANDRAACPSPFSSSPCRSYAPVPDFDAAEHFPDNKTLRLMNRDAQMAAVAARLAMQDAAVTPGALYAPDEIALYGATGLTGMPAEEIGRLVQGAAGPDGSLDMARMGQVALKRIRPVLSFKVLANMPICFVSIFENLRGPNAVYTPWEGQGAQAIATGIRAIAAGDVPCALVGGCDVKTHVFSFVTLEQLGVFDSWTQHNDGCIPGEGAAFLLLEDRQKALSRGANVYAVIRDHAIRPVMAGASLADTFRDVFCSLQSADLTDGPMLVAASDGDVAVSEAEWSAINQARFCTGEVIRPKAHLGNLFAAAAAVQVGLAAALVARHGAPDQVLADCFGHGSEQAAFLLEAV
jgi:3-oxoacyl-[acyl-carrier-protein] synthase II